ncbi:MAG: hypothetical protein VW715_15900 [Rhodospirillales bacterium]|jgi:hypothetical protein
MATRARIAIENIDGSIISSYHHWDGYPAGLGFNLLMNWSDPEKLQEAIMLGDASNWGKTAHPTDEDHSFNNPQEGVNVYYGRDRGEDNTAPVQFADRADFDLNWECCGEEFAYILNRSTGTWSMIDRYGERMVHDAEDEIVLARAGMIRMIQKEAA